MVSEAIKKTLIILGILGTGIGSIINNNILITIGMILGIIGIMMLVGLLKW